VSRQSRGRKSQRGRIHAANRAGATVGGETVVELLTGFLADDAVVPRTVPLTTAADALAEQAGRVIMRYLPEMREGATRTLLGCVCLGYGVLGSSADELPAWLTDSGEPVDIFDVMFLGAI
jgi:hypothetical protein